MKNKEKVKPEDRIKIIMVGLLEPGLFFIFDSYGLKYTTAIRASILLATIPIMTSLLAIPVLKEKLTWMKLLTTAGSIVGVYFVVRTQEPPGSGANYLLGDAFIFLACIAAAFYTVFARKLSFKYSYFTITRMQAIIAVVFFLPLAGAEALIAGIKVPQVNSLLAVLYLGVFSSALGYMLLNYTIAALSAANSSIFANLIPAVTMILSVLILNEFVGISKVFGLIIVTAFVILLSWYERNVRTYKKKV
jgi:drug/metabolite transporter (DMT)-like permease